MTYHVILMQFELLLQNKNRIVECMVLWACITFVSCFQISFKTLALVWKETGEHCINNHVGLINYVFVAF